MSNRLLGVLILFIFLLSGVLFFQYFFVANKVDININSNISDYHVELYAKKINKTFNFDCKVNNCLLSQLPFFDYDYTVTSTGYLENNGIINLTDESTPRTVDINFKRKIELEKIEKASTNVQEKIEELKKKKSLYKYFTFKGIGEVSFELVQDVLLDIFIDSQKIGQIDILSKDKINVLNIIGSSNYIFQFAEKQIIYDGSSSRLIETQLKVPVLYAKQGSYTQQILLVTAKGTYVLDIYTGEISYFSYFHDYIDYDGGYLGLILSDDSSRKNNLNLEEIHDNIVYYYNPEDKQTKIVYQTPLAITKIYSIEEKIIVEDEQAHIYEIKNIK